MAGLLDGESEISSKGEDKDNVGNLVHEIPIDLKIEILNRLEAKTLKRFQCVSNEWLSMIRSQIFINSFNTMSQTRPRFLVSVRNAENRVFLLSSCHYETERSNTSLVSLANPEMVNNTYYVKFVLRATSLHTNLEMTMDSSFGVDLVQCSPVHGLFGLSHVSHPGRFMICNPSTRQIITLPDIKASKGRNNGIHMFLGYDPVGNEYKAVCSSISYCGRFQVHKVLTLGEENLSWRDVKNGNRWRYNVVTNRICLNGNVYYGGYTLTPEKKAKMFWFDVRNERLRSFLIAENLVRDGSLINYKGKLASVVRNSYIRFDIYVIDDLSTGRMWVKDFLFHPILPDLSQKSMLTIVGMSKSNELIFVPSKLPHKDEPLYIYYYGKGGGNIFIRRVEFHGFEEFGCNHTSDEQCVCQIFFSPEHFETLLSL